MTGIPSPTTEGLGECAVIAVEVPVRVTVWASPPDVLVAKSALPAYVAVRVLAPGVRETSEQLPLATVPLHVPVPPLTEPFPGGEPLPGALAATVYVTVYGWPTVEGSGVSPVIVVTVLAALTVWLTPVDVLAAKL